MAHVLIVGQTLSGKSTLAKRLAATYKANGISVIVFDPVSDPEWSADFKTDDEAKFFEVYNSSRSCAVFVDEAGELCQGDYVNEIIRTATRGRHRGHRNHYIAQRATMVNRTIRDQCSELFLFNSGMEDCKIHAQDWNCPELRSHGPFLKKGEYFHKPRLGQLARGSLFEKE